MGPCTKSGYALGSLADQAGPSIGPVVSDNVDDGSIRCFANDVVRDDDSP